MSDNNFKIIVIYPGGNFKESFLKLKENIARLDLLSKLDVYYYGKVSNEINDINSIKIDCYSFNNIINILKKYDSMIFFELDVRPIYLNFKELNKYSFGVYDKIIDNHNHNDFNIPSHYKTVTNEIFYFTKKYKDYFINSLLENLKQNKKILDDNWDNIIKDKQGDYRDRPHNPRPVDKNFRYETSLLEIASSGDYENTFHIRRINNRRFIIDKGVNAELI